MGITPWRSVIRLPVVISVVLLSACSSKMSEPVVISGIAFFSMPWEARLAVPQDVPASRWRERLQARLDTINSSLSTYQPGTEVMRFNASAEGQPFQASHTLFSAVETAVDISARTGGVYDVTVGPLVNLWGFGAEAVPERVPDAAAIATARARTGWQYIGLERSTRTLTRQRDIQLDLSSIGEGVGVDGLSAELEQANIRNYMVSVAGTLRISGRKPDGGNWRIAVESPDGLGRPQVVLRLTGNMAVSTSGAYRNYHEIQGVRYSHTLDPRTGRPITHRGVSVTVVLPGGRAAVADAWATALNVLGPDEGLPVAEREGIAAYYLVSTDQGFRARYSSRFKSYLPEP